MSSQLSANSSQFCIELRAIAAAHQSNFDGITHDRKARLDAQRELLNR